MARGEDASPRATHPVAGKPAGMRLICELDVFRDVGLLQKMGVWSAAILIGGVAAIALALALGMVPEPLSWAWLAGLLVGTAVSFAAHELVHGLFFLLLGDRGTHISFGARQGMLYTRAEGLVMPARRFVVVLLAPACAVSVAIAAVGWAARVPLAAAIVLVLHLSGCVGDFAFVQAILESGADCAEDTKTGMRLYALSCEDGASKTEAGADAEVM